MSEEIKKLSPYNHVRLRTSVYYGSTSKHTQSVLSIDQNGVTVKDFTWVPAVYTTLREIIDNSLDEVVVKKCGNKINIDYNPTDMSFIVEDNGRGIPIDWDEEHKMHKATLALSELMAGRNFENRDNTAGMNGIGASGVNYCSEYFNIDIFRDNKHFHQRFTEGSDVFNALQIYEPVIKKHTSTKTGTKISFKLSKTVFPNPILPLDFVTSRVYELAYCNPTIQITFNGKLIKAKGHLTNTLFAKHHTISINVNAEGFNSDFYLVTDILESGEYEHSIVNNISTFDGGNHIDAFKKLFASGLLLALTKESKRRGLIPNRSDIYEKLMIFNVTTMKKPEFDSQSKTRLINDDIDGYIKEALDNEDIFKKLIKQNKSWIDQIYARCSARTQKKDDADLAKMGRKLMRNKVPKLLDANGKDRTKCILIITEGDCIDVESDVSVIRDAELTNIQAKDLELGDQVITHKNNIKPITNISHKVTKCIKINTRLGPITVGENHKLLVYDKSSHEFLFIKAIELDVNIHQLVKNRYVDMTHMTPVLTVKKINDNTFPLEITLGYELHELTKIKSSYSHIFGVYNVNTLCFEKIKAKDLIPLVHAFIYESTERNIR